MIYIHPVTTLQKMESSIAQTQSGLNLTADCSGGCTEPGYTNLPDYVACNFIVNSYRYEVSIFLPGEALSANEVLSACDVLINGNPINESGCVLSDGPIACGAIGNNYYFHCDVGQTPCASESSTITLSCDGYNQGAACDYTDQSL